jgi:peptide/nickel transport system permease protein
MNALRSPEGVVQRIRHPAWTSPELVLGSLLLLALGVLALLPSLVGTADPMLGDLAERLLPFGTDGHWLGTDHLGRDLLARTLAGLQWSLASGILATLTSATIGIAVGLIGAQSRGMLRWALDQSLVTAVSLPSLVIAVCIVAVFGQGFWPVVATLGLVTWPVFARVTLAEAQGLLTRDYVHAARLAGVSKWRIMLGHVLPGLRPTLLVLLAFHFADMLIAESALSFLGIGAPLGAPNWGNMLAESRGYLITAPWMLFAPAGAIVVAVVAVNLFAEGLSASMRRTAQDWQGR